MSAWFYLNFILFIIVIYQVVHHFSFPYVTMPILFGFLGFLFFLFNWTRNAVFSTIRSVSKRQTKIKLANMSKKIMPYHRWTGTAALVLIVVHAVFVIQYYGFSIMNEKMVVGLLALLNMIALVSTGWLRLVKPSGKMRRLHLRLGMLLFFLILVHVLL